MPLINVRYFAMLKEMAGMESEDISFEGSHLELYQFLSNKHQFDLPASMVQVAVNDEFSSMDKDVCNNSRVVFIPPVAGG